MKIANVHPLPWRRCLGAAACLLAATVCALMVVRAPFQLAGASTHVVVDLPQTLIGNQDAESGDFDTLYARSVLLGNLMTSPPVLDRIGRIAKVPPTRIAAATRVTANVPSVLTEPDSERRANDIAAAALPYRLEVQPSPNLPTLNVYAQAPSVDEAERLADAVAPALKQYLRELAARRGVDPAEQVSLAQLGPARGAVISGPAKPMVAGLTFILVLAASSVLMVGVGRVHRRARPVSAAAPAEGERDAAADERPAPPNRRRLRLPIGGGRPFALGGMLTPAVAVGPPAGELALPTLGVRRRLAAASVRAASEADAWPRTTRVLPWTIAGMMAMVWLVPFNSIVLDVPFPIDLKLDRLVLPVIVGMWLVAIAIGGPGAPRIRFTWIHVALAAVAGTACLSLVLGAHQLDRTLELQAGVKQLALLASYLTLFVVVSSSIRRAEVPAFLSYTLILAVLCALGTLLEYRSYYNVFYELPAKVLPGIFSVGAAESSAVDDIGRRVVRGPGEIPLEAVAMLAMGVPAALVGLMHSSEWRKRILYGIAAALLLAAMMSTFRKSAILAPVAVVFTLAYFRRRELLRLAPLALVLVLMIPVLAPGALGSVAFQLRGDRLGVNTVSDRTSDYDAIRPDVWSHLPFGRGYGTYVHSSYRILDMELLHQVVEVGVIGLASYLLVMVAIVGVARAPIRARRPGVAPVALAAAATAVAFLVVSTLFDVMSFPHCPYILLWMAGLLAVVAKPDDEPGEPEWSS